MTEMRSGRARGGAVSEASPGRVVVTAPARLHLGFLDLDGGLGRRFGSLGIALDRPVTRVAAWRGGPGIDARGPERERAGAYAAAVAGQLGVAPDIALSVEQAIPGHAGLGSGTQLALAVGLAVARLHGAALDARAVAERLHRGARSSIGIAAFERGGVVLDGGRGSADRPPPVLCRLPFPEAWRILLILDRRRHGLSGTAEREAFGALPPFPPSRAAELCRVMLMQALPALAEQELAGFAAGVAALQRATGDHFAPHQGGRYASPGVAAVLAWLESLGLVGIGQSSWGPTGFALVGSAAEGERLLAEARRRWPEESGLEFALCRGRNHGGEIEPPAGHRGE
ncbi:MAG: beta-ribofuranosylaminobenzene 5'-phosphate synthase family protein [Dongiaceae bacterium]